MSEKVYYRSLPGAFAAREASMSQFEDEEREAFVNGFLQGVQWANPDPDVQQCPSCGSLMVHMSGADKIKMGAQLVEFGLQYESRIVCQFSCRHCGHTYNAHLKIAAV